MAKNNRTLLLIIFLLGVFIGALDTGIVSPARTVIASQLSISSSSSIWIVTIYTLAYAVSMPIAGKFSDRYGKKKVFTLSITLFGIGSLLCGISNYAGSFSFLLAARVIQALGGGGIMPVATAYIGESFPIEKRGSALGLVGAMYGVSTTLGPTVGSALLNLVGNSNWGVLFLINVPICIGVIIAAVIIKDEGILKEPKKMDVLGSIIVTVLILSLMYALTNLQFHDFKNSIASTKVWPYLLTFIILLPIFIIVEKRSLDPILNLKYFTNREIALTLLISFITGAGMMGIVFVPQFGENALKLKTGSGGYLVTLMAIFSGVSAPLGGRLVDKYSPKLVLSMGFASTFIGTSTLAFIVAKNPSFVSLLFGLAFIGLGMGFCMGTPLNYLMQTNVDPSETASAQSTLSLIRSIGVAISPNILIGFISEAGKNISPKLMAILPKVAIPGSSTAVSMTQGNSSAVSPDQLAALQNADVTTITDVLKQFSSSMIDKFSPMLKQQLQNIKLPKGVTVDTLVSQWKSDYLSQIESLRSSIENVFQSTLNEGFSKLFIGAAVIALLGLIFTLLLSKKNKLASSN
ncbi:MFS transporter [Clostridium sp. YIM B02505]|uniref:MFS transporter n=1 Tax=Clostridium yunnanense TaxID=2800325 RepID=A0ABS1EVP8_9CLOT|nr:MFS transporter [Clostridium yunnanense]MBK1813462.1 MFS transporter [Clostridium yunnanense]